MKRLCAQAALAFAVSVTATQTPAQDAPKAKAGYYWTCNKMLGDGMATHYELDGNRTASGAIFSSAKFTAASLNTKMIPFSRSKSKKIYIKVVYGVTKDSEYADIAPRIDYNRDVFVDMNDLGAYHGGTNEPRIIDLSLAGKDELNAVGNPFITAFLCKQEKIPLPMQKSVQMIIATSADPETLAKKFLAATLVANAESEFKAPFDYWNHYEAVLGYALPPTPMLKSVNMIIATGGQIPTPRQFTQDDYNVLVAAGLMSPTQDYTPALAFR